MAERKHARGGSVREHAPEMMEQAQRRVTRALRSSKPEDVLIKAAFGAVAATLIVRLIRQTPLGALAVRLAPVVAFIGLYDMFSEAAER